MDNKDMPYQKVRKSIAQLIKPFPGRWVALSADDREVISVGKSARAVFDQARKKGESCPHLMKSPDSSTVAFIY